MSGFVAEVIRGGEEAQITIGGHDRPSIAGIDIEAGLKQGNSGEIPPVALDELIEIVAGHILKRCLRIVIVSSSDAGAEIRHEPAAHMEIIKGVHGRHISVPNSARFQFKRLSVESRKAAADGIY